MELDMYLIAKRYLVDVQLASTISELFPEIKNCSKIEEVSSRVAYWYKANHIHQWFIRNLKKEFVNGGTYLVSREELEKLRNTCKCIIKYRNLAEEFLPVDTEKIEETYFNQISDTIFIIDMCLNFPTAWEFYYQARW